MASPRGSRTAPLAAAGGLCVSSAPSMPPLRTFLVVALLPGGLGAGCGAVFPRYTTATRRVPAGMLEERSVRPPPEDVHEIVVVSAELPPSREDGQPWDSDGGPDLYAIIRRNGTEVYRSPVVADSTRPEWHGASVTLRVRPTDVLRFELWDDDGLVDQPVGAEQVTGIPSSALDGGNWVVRFQRNALLYLAARSPEPRYGLGATFESHEDFLRIVELEEGSPGRIAGLREGDQVVSIDGRRVVDLGELGARQAMDRAAIRAVVLTVERDGSPRTTVTVEPGAVYVAQ